MTDFTRGSIWLAKSARWSADGTEHKRPVLIVSNNKYNSNSEEVICMHITTDVRHECSLMLDYSHDMEANRLVDASAVRYDAIARYPVRIFEKKLGAVKEEKLAELVKKLVALLSK
jgi:mRNA interferase MazF